VGQIIPLRSAAHLFAIRTILPPSGAALLRLVEIYSPQSYPSNVECGDETGLPSLFRARPRSVQNSGQGEHYLQLGTWLPMISWQPDGIMNILSLMTQNSWLCLRYSFRNQFGYWTWQLDGIPLHDDVNILELMTVHGVREVIPTVSTKKLICK
jgi:hypothetical protein